MRLAVLTLLLLFGLVGPSAADDHTEAGRADPYQANIDAILAHIEADDRAAVAAAVEYPLRFWHDGEELFVIGNPADFIANYETLLPADLREDVLALDGAGYARFTQGVMIGDGEIWFNGDASRIRTLNGFEAAPALISASFAEAYRRSKALGLDEFLWQGERYTTE